MIKVGIIGGADYTSGELIRLLINHPDADVLFVHSPAYAGTRLTSVYEGLYGECELSFTDRLPLEEIDVLFCCDTEGETRRFVEAHTVPESLRIIDLSMDYRLADASHAFIYGLPELNRRAICHSKYVANPGALATCVELGLLPLAKQLMLGGDIVVNVLEGSTSQAEKHAQAGHFSWRSNNHSVSRAFDHPQLPEITQSLKQLQNSFDADISLVSCLGDFPRGVFTSIWLKSKVSLDELYRIFVEYYSADSFVHVVRENIDLKQVVNTNKCLIHLEKQGDKLLIISCIDNLLKGASGQAVHNMNLLFNLEETVGLRLKSSAF